MKKIELIEEAIREQGRSLKELGINRTLYWAYLYSKEAENELIDFGEVVWDYDIPELAAFFKEQGIDEFTISSSFSGLLETLAGFEKEGFKVAAMTTVRARYTNYLTGEKAIIPAIKLVRN